MTVAICWERAVGPLSELIFASDSRLGGGEAWDACPKLFDIGRTDAALAFAGDTHRAYPFVLQAIASIAAYKGSERRSLDITQLIGHLVHSMDQMLSMAVGPAADSDPDCEFILGGWSWRLGRFRAYRIFYEPTAKRFVSVAAPPAPDELGGPAATPIYAAIGDAASAALSSMSEARRGSAAALDMLPLDTIGSLCATDTFATVGGSPQVIKVYRYMTVETFAVEWNERTTIAGRPLRPSENHDLRVLTLAPDEGWVVTPPGQIRESGRPPS